MGGVICALLWGWEEEGENPVTVLFLTVSEFLTKSPQAQFAELSKISIRTEVGACVSLCLVLPSDP